MFPVSDSQHTPYHVANGHVNIHKIRALLTSVTLVQSLTESPVLKVVILGLEPCMPNCHKSGIMSTFRVPLSPAS